MKPTVAKTASATNGAPMATSVAAKAPAKMARTEKVDDQSSQASDGSRVAATKAVINNSVKKGKKGLFWNVEDSNEF